MSNINNKLIKFLTSAFCLSLLSVIIGILIVENEVPQDNWYVEASADGLFGPNNRSLWGLCSNFIITSIIYVLSLLKIRLYWLHIIIVIFLFLSNYLMCVIIKDKLKDISRYSFMWCAVFLFLVTPYIFYSLGFTVPASYICTIGMVWIYHCCSCKTRIVKYFPGYFCFIVGFSLRWECVIFGGAFLAPLLLIEFITSIREKKVGLFIRKYVPPYIVLILLFVIITGVQLIGLNHNEPGFYKWNVARSSVGDYDIIPYEGNECIYKSLGVKKSEYDLMRSWNLYDKDLYTEEYYSKVKQNTAIEKKETSKYYTEALEDCMNNPFCGLMILIILFSIFYGTKTKLYLLIRIGILFVVYYLITLFFLYLGRLIDRIDYSIILAFFICAIYCVCEENWSYFNKERLSGDIKIFLFFCIVFVLYFKPVKGDVKYDNLGGKSISKIYADAIVADDSFGYYLVSNLVGKDTCKPITYNNNISNTVLSNKENIYIELFCYTWKQSYPLTDKNIFYTGDEGLGSNIAFVGQYMADLSPIQNNYLKYGVNNNSPYKSIMNPNVYILVRESEQYDRARECYEYIKDYYNSEVQYSVTDIVEDAAVGKFLSPLDVTLYDDEMEDLDISFINNYEYEGFSAIKIMDTDFLENNDIKYIQLTGQDGERYCFEEFNGNNGLFVFFDDILKSGKNYSVQLIVDNEVVKRVIALNDKLTID